MHSPTLQVANTSSDKSIQISFNPPEDANVPDKTKRILISPKETKKMAVQEGTMNLFVWNESVLLWKGIVPTKIQKPLLISPDTKEVMYGAMILPEGFNPITDPSHSGFVQQSTSLLSNSTLIILLVILIICGIGLYIYFFKKQ